MANEDLSILDIFPLVIDGQEYDPTIMAGVAPEGSQFDTRQFVTKMNELLSTDGQDFFTSYDEVLKNHQQFSREESSFFYKGLEVIQQARSGTGKTATFCSGILQQLDYNVVECQALVLAPTRELAQQIEKVIRALRDYLGVKVHACVGGTSIREDLCILSAGVHVVVGTPGRVFDMLRRREDDKQLIYICGDCVDICCSCTTIKLHSRLNIYVDSTTASTGLH
ncbi:DNA/RNA helicase, DEAD/DEAH box type, N-terminal [Cynara cardunculus var. scolymus]|uniref:ATP-dependent RNA helicase n=1 Tax=Cynara cardunculus var. scolymus TaxID=59895 RepID=A0A124SB68_CYNCS|nr:DNA/RNA helicase, DEAD/DEAH box type, N-terminal [Cynara cardunculus var. scolymus]